jgi:hypothetical protein
MGATSDGLVRVQPGGRGAALRPRRLVGRDREIAEVTEIVAVTPLTTVTGPGGVGKTALALAVAAASAAQFSDGVFVVWLASLRSAEHIAGEVAAQVGMPRSGGQSYEDGLTEWLAERLPVGGVAGRRSPSRATTTPTASGKKHRSTHV